MASPPAAPQQNHSRRPTRWLRTLSLCIASALCTLSMSSHAQVVTNWVAFNDHAPSATTAPFVTAYNLRGMGLAATPTLLLPTKGRLTNFIAGAYPAGQPLSAQIVVTALNTPNLFPNAGMAAPFPATPAYDLFNGIVDLANADSAIGLSAGELDTIILTFTNLNPAMRYTFRGTAVRNGPTANVHPGRWSISSISGAAAFVTAHTPDVLTTATIGVPGLSLTNGQGVFQAGVNTNGQMVGWDDIAPSPAGTFSIVTRGYSGPVTGGSFGSLVTNAFDNLGYALCGIMLAEYGPLTGVSIVSQPATSLTLTQGQTLTLSVTASGSAPGYQWSKTGTGEIAGATDSIYTIPSADVPDSGSYYVVVSNGVNTFTSDTSVVSVVQDTFAPKVINIFAQASLDQITIEFDEPLASGTEDVFNFAVDGPDAPELTASVFGPNPSVVILTVSAAKPLAPNTAYDLVVSSPADALGNEVPIGTRYPFRSSTATGLNGLLFEAYRPISGNPITNLTGSALFPNSPQETLRMTKFDSREVYPDDTHENYGARIRGLFIPPVSGSYKFYLRSDDSSELYLNPTGPSASGKMRVAEEVACCRTFLEDSPGVLASAAFPMKAGQGYYIEALYKEGGGGDFCQVAAKLESDPTEASTLLPLTGAYLGYPGAPSGIGGGVTITLAPTNTTVLENQPYVLAVRATNVNGLPIGYQWKRDGVDIPGATGPTYTGSIASFANDNNATFSVAVSVIGSETVTTPVTLTVIPDTVPPTIVSVQATEFFDKLYVVFDEPLDPISVDAFTLAIIGGPIQLNVQSATLQSDGRTVLIVLDPATKLTEATDYSVVAPGVTDLIGNTYAAGPSPFTSFKMTLGFLNFAVYDTGGGNDVSILTSHPTFPDFPRDRLFLTAFDSRTAYPDDSNEAYGGRITGLFIPPTSGNWIFYLRSDDGGELFMNPLGTDPAGKISLTAEPTCCNPFSAHASAPQALTAGVPVFIEALYKEGAGGDICQVAAKLESDPTPADVLKPIPGAYLACYAPFEGASITITNQPTNQTAPVSSPTRLVGLTSFTGGSGGYRVSNLNAPGAPWSYDPTTGVWSCHDQPGCAPAPRSSRLNSPTFTVTTSGAITLTLTHRHSFEEDTTRWDGGQVRISVNRGSYVAVPLASFTVGGYNGTVGGTAVPNTEITGQDAFVGTSAGHGTATYITSTATLGTFNVGDLVSVQFLAAWDDCTEGALPNWEIKTVELSPTVENREADGPVSLVAGAFATATFTSNAPVVFQWQKLVGGTFVDVADATSSTFTFVPTTDEDATLFRCLVRSIGDDEATVEAIVRLAPAITIDPGTGTLVLKWPASLVGYSVESAGSFAIPASATVWEPATGTAGSGGGYNTLTVPSGTGQTFFRLKKP